MQVLKVMAYTIVLLVFSIIGATRGHKVWTSSVREANFLAPAGDAAGFAASGAAMHGAATSATTQSVSYSQYPPSTAPSHGFTTQSYPTSPAPESYGVPPTQSSHQDTPSPIPQGAQAAYPTYPTYPQV